MGLLNGDFYTCSVWPQDGICNVSVNGSATNYVKKELYKNDLPFLTRVLRFKIHSIESFSN